MNEDIKNEIISIYKGKVSFRPEKNISHIHTNEDGSSTHYECYLGADNIVYNTRTEYYDFYKTFLI